MKNSLSKRYRRRRRRRRRNTNGEQTAADLMVLMRLPVITTLSAHVTDGNGNPEIAKENRTDKQIDREMR